MEVDEMVDAELAGLDLGEAVTIPSLPDAQEWDAFTAARLGMDPRLSLNYAASRRGIAMVNAKQTPVSSSLDSE